MVDTLGLVVISISQEDKSEAQRYVPHHQSSAEESRGQGAARAGLALWGRKIRSQRG